jgi:hypothetical protein
LSTFGWFLPSYNKSLLLRFLPEADEKNKVLKRDNNRVNARIFNAVGIKVMAKNHLLK